MCEIKFARILSLWHGGVRRFSSCLKIEKSAKIPCSARVWGDGGWGGVAVSGYFYIFSRTSKRRPIFAKEPIFELGCSIGIRWWLHVNSWSQEPPLWGGYLLWDKCYIFRFSYSAGGWMIEASAVERLRKAKYCTQIYCKVTTNYRYFLLNWDRGEEGAIFSGCLIETNYEHFLFCTSPSGTIYSVRINCVRLYS